MSFLSWFRAFGNWFPELIGLKGTRVKQGATSPQNDVCIKVCKTPPLRTTNQVSMKGEVLGGHVLDTLARFCQTNIVMKVTHCS